MRFREKIAYTRYGGKKQTKKNKLASDGDRTHGVRISAPML